MNKCCSIKIVFGNIDEANNSIDVLLNKKLISCAQIIDCNSKWLWKGAIEQAKEYIVILKTKKSLIDEIWDEVKKIHSYDCFEMSIIDNITFEKSYEEWIIDEIK